MAIKIAKCKKVVVAMSGGLDSSVAAAILKQEGFSVVGVFMKFWTPGGGGQNRCCSPESEVRARKVAKVLKIPFYVLNFEREFKKRVVDYFINGYKKGETPNPCVVCNKEIKFGLLMERALKLDADYVATGHYSLKRELKTKNSKLKITAQNSKLAYKLLMAKDRNKDQSYFLWKLNQCQLSRVLFPIGDYTRKEVENLAKKFKLPFSGVEKSMETCFVPTTTSDFLGKYLKEKPGAIVDTSGEKIGKHRGLWFYTIGQRKGLGFAGGPYWVKDKNLKKNALIITQNEKGLEKRELRVKNINWISGIEPRLPLKIRAKIRYRHQSAMATLSGFKTDAHYKIYSLKFKVAQRAITPGQSAVFYSANGRELLGGGIIC